MNLSPQQETINLERAHRAVSYLEQLEYAVSTLKSIAKIDKVNGPELEAVAARLDALYQALDNTEEGAAMIEDGRKLSDIGGSKIERLRLGGEIVRMRNNGKTYKEIGEYLDLDQVSVSKFCKAYDAAPPSERAAIRKTSIFDIANNMEELGAMIYRQLARLEQVDPEHHVKYTAELRQLLTAAEKFMNANDARRKGDEIKQMVLEILIDELPEKRAAIIKRFGSAGISRGLLAG